jgi:2-polyprenyl-3-methyl-5-hydroxy-6-metoxy-1,4-benzoquinol methylase
MGFLIPPLSRTHSLELMDLPCEDRAELRGNLRDLERLNRCFGGTSVIVSRVSRIVKQYRLSGRVTLLDAGTGGADIPRALVRWAQRKGLQLEVVACDRSEAILGVATELSADYPQISFLNEDVLKLSFPPRSFDVATCSLTAHHLSSGQVVSLFRKLDKISRYGFVVSDLERSRRAHAGVWLATRLLTRNRLTRHDGPLSVFRAYTLEEMRNMARQAGCGSLCFFRRPWFRIVVVQEKAGLEG